MFYYRDLSLSENHVVALDFNGNAYSWGQGKYGELCLEKTIYSPFPTKLTNNKLYKKVFCDELITCFINDIGEISYFGVIVKIFQSSEHKQTLKNLWKDESNIDPTLIFKEKIITELSSERIENLAIGNGFIGLLSEKGLVYAVDMSDNITLLYSKFFIFSITVSNNQLFGLGKELNNDQSFTEKESIYHRNIYMTKWEVKSKESNEEWNTTLYKLSEDFTKENLQLDPSKNKEILLFNFFHFNPNASCNSLFKETNSVASCSFQEKGFNSFYNENQEKQGYNILSLISNFDDSYNIKYKRKKNNSEQMVFTTLF